MCVEGGGAQLSADAARLGKRRVCDARSEAEMAPSALFHRTAVRARCLRRVSALVQERRVAVGARGLVTAEGA